MSGIFAAELIYPGHTAKRITQSGDASLAELDASMPLRNLLLATAAGAGVLIGHSQPVTAQTVIPPSSGSCIVSGTSATCTGDVSSGVAASAPLTTLNVNNLTQDIAPASGVDGIDLTSTTAQDITIDVDLGSSSITSTGASNGIDARLGVFLGNVDGNITVTSEGTVTGGRDGINADHFGNGNTTITSTGAITAGTGNGIDASREGGDGAITITNTGDIDANGDGINAFLRLEGSVTVTSTGNITTQSGIGIDATGGSAASTVVTSVGNITANSEGIEASSENSVTVNSTGNVYSATRTGIEAEVDTGSATVTSSGDVTSAVGDALRIDVNTSGTSTVNLMSGAIDGGTGTGSGVSFEGAAGVSNTLNNYASITAQSGLALSGENGDELINNSGTITGNVTLGAGTNTFNNLSAGVFNSGTTVTLGAGNSLTNAGNLSPGGASAVSNTALTGDLTQTSSGTTTITVDTTAGTADRIDVSGSASFNGTITPQLINLTAGQQTTTIVSASGGTVNAGLALATGPALQASLSYPNANDIVLSTSIDLAVGGLNSNQASVANSLNTALSAGPGDTEPILSALVNGVFSMGAYQEALDQLSAEVFLNTETASLFAANDFSNLLFSCDVAGDGSTAISEGQCVWVRPHGRFTRRNDSNSTVGFQENTGGLAAGVQVEFAPSWYAGLGLGYERFSLSTNADADSDGNRFTAGATLKFQNGPFLLAAAVSGGIDSYNTDRTINFGGLDLVAASDHNVSHVTAQARAAYLLTHETWFFTPQLDVNVTHLNRGGVTESGGGGANLSVSGNSDTYVSISPAVEIGNEIELFENSLLRPYVRAGLSYYPDSDNAVAARFANAPAGTSAFTNSSDFGDVFADVAVGATAFLNEGATLKVSYDGLFSSDTQQHGFSLKGSLRF
ncbi:autotransporter domain-containing protein [Roseibium sp. HPY-6]|uniref:autotransporter outer membrane beta-barrel domain-containing protein n=1 Tax=Roseibium sp. HPY-6 TaxID=3229852 RepID=UPI00338D60B6